MLIFFELLAALALGFVLGRLWEIRQEMQRAPESRNRIPTTRLEISAAIETIPRVTLTKTSNAGRLFSIEAFSSCVRHANQRFSYLMNLGWWKPKR